MANTRLRSMKSAMAVCLILYNVGCDISDSFFFKSRQDARINHVEYGCEAKANNKAGSKKYPLTLTVTSEPRQQEVRVMLEDAGLLGEN